MRDKFINFMYLGQKITLEHILRLAIEGVYTAVSTVQFRQAGFEHH